MKNFSILLILLGLFACKKESANELAIAAAESCLETPLTDTLTLSNQLVGEWEMLTFRCDDCPESDKKRYSNGQINFATNDGEFTYLDYDVFIPRAFSWDIDASKGVYLQFNGDPTQPFRDNRVFIRVCDGYLGLDDTLQTGVYFIFKKM